MKRTIFVLLILFGFVGEGKACLFPGDPPSNTPQWVKDYELATIVFVGEFQEVQRTENKSEPLPEGTGSNAEYYEIEATFKVTKYYKGMFGKDTLKIRTIVGGVCGSSEIHSWETEKRGAQWLIYTNLSVDKKTGELSLHSSQRNGNSPIEKAGKKNLKFLQQTYADMRKRMTLLD